MLGRILLACYLGIAGGIAVFWWASFDYTHELARRKGYTGWAWFATGLLLPFVGPLVALCLPRRPGEGNVQCTCPVCWWGRRQRHYARYGTHRPVGSDAELRRLQREWFRTEFLCWRGDFYWSFDQYLLAFPGSTRSSYWLAWRDLQREWFKAHPDGDSEAYLLDFTQSTREDYDAACKYAITLGWFPRSG